MTYPQTRQREATLGAPARPRAAPLRVVVAGALAGAFLLTFPAVGFARPVPGSFADLAAKVTPAVVTIATEQKVTETLQDNTGTTRLVLLDADFKTTPASVTSGVNTVNDASTKITVLNVIVPIVAGVIGIILLVLGLVLSRRRPEDEEYEDDDETVRVSA